MATRCFHYTKANGQEVQLRVFLPLEVPEGGPKKPAVVMVCGLMWLGQGLLGQIGLHFNDIFGYSFAKHGVPCIQLHTPSRHIAFTRLMDLACLALSPLGYYFWPRILLILGDLSLLAIDSWDILPVILISLASSLGIFALPVIHLVARLSQWARGVIPGPKFRDHQAEIGASVEWAQKHSEELLKSNGKVVLCGYSSGGHCASLFAGSKSAPPLQAVLLVSGLYGLRTHLWTGVKQYLAPLFNLVFLDVLGIGSDDERNTQSPESMIERDLDGQDWYILSAQMELMNFHPFQDIIFSTKALCDALVKKGAKIHRATCGLNHWLLITNFPDFVGPFCKSL